MGTVIDLTGRRFGRLLVGAFAGLNIHRKATWHCRCDCGASPVVVGRCLLNGATKSCGCLHRIRASTLNRKHGGSTLATFSSWRAMMRRCYQPKNSGYPTYGARGITVCAAWHDYERFAADMGPRPPGTSIDRYPNGDGNYEPGNCRWATPVEQRRNSLSHRLWLKRAAEIRAHHQMVGGSITAIARALNVHRATVRRALSAGDVYLVEQQAAA